MFAAYIYDQDGDIIGGQDDGYVPDFFTGSHGGDYIILYIDLETGKITNWTKPSKNDIEQFIKEVDE